MELDNYLVAFSIDDTEHPEAAVQAVTGVMQVRAEDIPHACEIAKDYFGKNIGKITFSRVQKAVIQKDNGNPA